MLKLLWGDNPGYMSRGSQPFHEWSKTSRKAVAEETCNELPLGDVYNMLNGRLFGRLAAYSSFTSNHFLSQVFRRGRG